MTNVGIGLIVIEQYNLKTMKKRSKNLNRKDSKNIPNWKESLWKTENNEGSFSGP